MPEMQLVDHEIFSAILLVCSLVVIWIGNDDLGGIGKINWKKRDFSKLGMFLFSIGVLATSASLAYAAFVLRLFLFANAG